MDIRLDGRTALVTGASRGIGLAIATELSASGANVMLVSRTLDDLERAAATLPGPTAVFAGKVADESVADAAVAATIERFGRLDILVNNVSTNIHFGSLTTISAVQAEKTVATNQWAPVMWIQKAWNAGMSEHGGRIINITSMGATTPEPNIGWYNGTKAAVDHLTRQLAQELGPKVTVNAVAPGVIKTDMSRALWETGAERVAARVPLARLGVPEDIAGVVAFLASDAAAYITGATIAVDGGISLGMGVTT